MIGQVVKVISGFYDINSNNKIYRVRGSNNLRDNKITPLVGDIVEFSENGFLTNIFERKNFLIRPKVANVSQVAIICSLIEPKFSSLLLDRFLAIIEFQNIKPLIIFTKSDLVENFQPYDDYIKQKYKCFLIDNMNKKNLMLLKNELKNNLTVFTGQSGVGKTTTINNLFDLELKTNSISKALGRGKHTTRIVEIFTFDSDIKVIDTPGFGSIQVNLTQQELANSYFDFKIWSKKCKFRSCLHFKEEDCYVKMQLKKNNLLESRYNNYIKILLEDTWKK